MKNTDRETMKKLATENGLTADHFFKSPQGFVIITRQGIERIQQHRGIRVRYEMVHIQMTASTWSSKQLARWPDQMVTP